jgi:hypothetical protein
MMDHNEFGR